MDIFLGGQILHPRMDLGSFSGGASAVASTRAASSARLRPELTPTPSMAVPLLHITVFTSAKSTLTSPGTVMMSLMPCTPCRPHQPLSFNII